VPLPPVLESANALDLSPRIVGSTTVVASPTDNTETIIASVTVPGGLSYATGVFVVAWAAFTVGTSGTAVNLRVRQTDVAGAVKAATGAVNEGVTAATQLGVRVAWGLDAAPADGQIYKATLTVTGGAAASTVSAVFLGAIAV
jgi:hypothetical protein